MLKKENIRKVYNIFNWISISGLIYVMLLPLISIPMNWLCPQLWTCSYLRITGNPCPFCGLTRDFSACFTGNETRYNPCGDIYLLVIISLLLFRIVAIIAIPYLSECKLKLFGISDLVLHIFTLCGFFFLAFNTWLK